LPLILLYEICIWLAWLMERRRARARAGTEVLPPS
jgi:Sec-independent protein secretion pathway component TatC